MKTYRRLNKLIILVLSFILSIVFTNESQAAPQGYCHNETVNNAVFYCNRVGPDGYLMMGEHALYLGPDVLMDWNYDSASTDCAHYVSACAGNHPRNRGGGINFPQDYGGAVYGLTGASTSMNWIVSNKKGRLVSSISSLRAGDLIYFDSTTYSGDPDHSAVSMGGDLISTHSKNRCAELISTVYNVRKKYYVQMNAAGDINRDNSSLDRCGDGTVDIIDVIEQVDIALSKYSPTPCQKIRGDIATGPLTNCRLPNGRIDLFDILGTIDLVLGEKTCVCNGYCNACVNRYIGSSSFLSESDADIGLSIENFDGFIETASVKAPINLNNQTVSARGIQFRVCDQDDYLNCLSCTPTERSENMICKVKEQDDGCCEVMLMSVNSDAVVLTGSGPVAYINYEVSDDAPLGQCKNVNLVNATVIDEDSQALGVSTMSAKVCFKSCLDGCVNKCQ